MKQKMIKAVLTLILAAGILSFGPLRAEAAGTTVLNGVDYAAVYDYDYYLAQYPELNAVFGGNPSAALQHFVSFGMNEGRQGCAAFSVLAYKNRYADLRQVFGENNRAYYYHYMSYGRAEGRNGSGGGYAPQSAPVQAQTNQNAGTSLPGASDQARAKLNEIGRDLAAAYNWSRSLTWTNQYTSPDAGTRAMANTGFSTGTGGCYVMAATFYEMARELGYDAHQMSGYVPRRGGGLAIHSWVEVVIGGVTYVVDPDFAYESGGNGYLIQYGQTGTWRYQSYYRMN